MSELNSKKCRACDGTLPPLTPREIERHLGMLKGWILEQGRITKVFEFKNYYQTLAFVNASAWVSHRENHHPDIEVGYNRCKLSYVTHAISGLSENDFICAAKMKSLFEI